MAASREWVVLEKEVKELFERLELISSEDYKAFVRERKPRSCKFWGPDYIGQNTVRQIDKIFEFLEREAYNHQAEFKTEIQRANILYKLTRQLCYFADPRSLRSGLWSMWEMEELEFGNFLQWLPRETLSDTIALYTPFGGALPKFLHQLSELWEVFDMTAMMEQKKFASLLTEAVRSNNTTLIDFLIAHGADLNISNSGSDFSLLDLARAYRNEKMIKFLLDRGAPDPWYIYRARSNVNLFFSGLGDNIHNIMALLSNDSNSQSHLPDPDPGPGPGPGFGR